MQVVIFAAGKSTRTYPLTLTRPKPLLPVANKPILAHQLDALKGLVDEAVLVVGYKHEMLRDYFGDSYGDIRLRYVVQTEQRGTGHALLQCADVIDAPFLAMNGDDLYAAADLARIAALPLAALAKPVEDPRLYGIFDVDNDNRVKRLVEKPTEVFSNLANIGVYKLSPAIFEILYGTEESPRGEIEITAAIEVLAQRESVQVVPVEGYWLPIGYPWHLLDANTFYLETLMQPINQGNVSPAAHLEGPVSIGRGTVIRPGVVIDGPVLIGEHCEIGPNCWLRPGTSIGDHCKVGQGSEIKNSILFEGAKAPHLNYVGDSIIGAGANLGCGTVTANYRHDGKNHHSIVKGELVDTGRRKFGAVLGDDVHTGIHTAIYPGRKMWPHTSTLPGEVVKSDRVE